MNWKLSSLNYNDPKEKLMSLEDTIEFLTNQQTFFPVYRAAVYFSWCQDVQGRDIFPHLQTSATKNESWFGKEEVQVLVSTVLVTLPSLRQTTQHLQLQGREAYSGLWFQSMATDSRVGYWDKVLNPSQEEADPEEEPWMRTHLPSHAPGVPPLLARPHL